MEELRETLRATVERMNAASDARVRDLERAYLTYLEHERVRIAREMDMKFQEYAEQLRDAYRAEFDAEMERRLGEAHAEARARVEQVMENERQLVEELTLRMQELNVARQESAALRASLRDAAENAARFEAAFETERAETARQLEEMHREREDARAEAANAARRENGLRRRLETVVALADGQTETIGALRANVNELLRGLQEARAARETAEAEARRVDASLRDLQASFQDFRRIHAHNRDRNEAEIQRLNRFLSDRERDLRALLRGRLVRRNPRPPEDQPPPRRRRVI